MSPLPGTVYFPSGVLFQRRMRIWGYQTSVAMVSLSWKLEGYLKGPCPLKTCILQSAILYSTSESVSGSLVLMIL